MSEKTIIKSMQFPCTKCGLCCQHVDRSAHTEWLNRGDGICRNLNINTNLCEIYEDRPKICQIDNSFHYFSSQISYIDYHIANAEVCNALQEEHGLPQYKRVIILGQDSSLN